MVANLRILAALGAAALMACSGGSTPADAGSGDAVAVDASRPNDSPPADAAGTVDVVADGATGSLPEGDCDPLDEGECALPFPSNLYLRREATRRTGFALQFGPTSLPPNAAGEHPDPDSLRFLDGYGLGTPIITSFREVDLRAMAGEESIDRSLADDAPVLLFEVAGTTLRRVPYWVEYDNAQWEPEASRRLLFVRPAVILKEATRYIVAFRNLRTLAGAPVEPSAAFRRLREGMTAGDPALAPRQARFNEIFTLLESTGLRRADLTLAWDWNTASSEALHGRLLAMRDEALRTVGASTPPFFITAVRRFGRPGSGAPMTDEHIALSIEGDINVPNFMRTRRAAGFGVWEMVTDANGRPRINPDERETPVHFWVRIPHSAVNGPPHGLVQYGHGLLGSGEEVEAGYNGRIANDHNLIFFAADFEGMSTEDVGPVLASLRDVSNFRYVAQRQHQGFVNWAVLLRSIRERLTEVPEVREANVRLNREEVFYSGISQGGIFGATYLAISPDITRGHLGVPGINYNLLLRRSVNFEGYGNMLRTGYPSSRHQAINLAFIQLHWDATDPVSYVRHVTQEPFTAGQPRFGLWVPARGDYQVSVMTNEIMARSDIGIPLLANYDRDRRPFGITPVPYPRRGSGVVLYNMGNPWPTPGNHPPMREMLGDPHGRPRSLAWHQRQMVTFFRTGEIIDVCGGDGCTPD